jgi:hypothetical protein
MIERQKNLKTEQFEILFVSITTPGLSHWCGSLRRGIKMHEVKN